MSILAVCPDCSKEYKVPDERAGTKIRCKVCKGVIQVEELEESPLIQDQKQKVQKKQKQATKQSKKFKQNLTQVVLVLVGVGALLAVGLAAALMPAFRDIFGLILLIGGIGSILIAWLVIMWTEESFLLVMLMRFFPPAILVSVFMRLDEVWPWALLGFGGAVAMFAGLALRGA